MKRLLTIVLAFGLVALSAFDLHGQETKSEPETKKTEKAQNENPFESDYSTPQVQFSVSLSPKDAFPGDEVTLTIKTTIDSGWHIYGIEDDDSAGGLPTKIRVRSRSLQPLEDVFTPSTAPSEVDVHDEKQKQHSGEFEWTRKFKVKPRIENYFASGSITFQACNETSCLPPKKVTFRAGLKPGVARDYGPPKPASRKISETTIGEPIVVALEACEATRPKVSLSIADIFAGGLAKDELVLRGSIDVDGKKTDVYLPKSRRYKLTNSEIGETRFSNNSTYASLDYDGDGNLDAAEHAACNRPIRVLDSMFQVTEIHPTKRTMTFQQVDVPLSGSILNRRCPDFEFKTIDGETTIDNKSILGKVTILDIWAVT